MADRGLMEAPPPSSALGVRDTPLGMLIPDEISREEWVAIGRRLAGDVSTTMWRLGDWLRAGYRKWGNMYDEASEITGLEVQTLKNVKAVAGAFHSYRRRYKEGLSFSHHAEVASLIESAQDYWLELAEQGQWSQKVLRGKLQEAGVIGSGRKQGELAEAQTFRFTFTETERVQTWTAAAEHRGVTLEEFAVQVLDEAARVELAEAA